MGELRGRKTISKYTAVVDSEQGPLMELVPHLESLGFRCLRVPGAQACVDLLNRFPKLSWVAVNANELGNQADGLLEVARRIQPKMSILWLEPEGMDRQFHESVSRVSELPDYEHIAELVDDALRSRFYDNALVSSLRHHTERSLASLGTFAILREPFIKASRSRLSDVNAVLTFTGDRACGYLVVSFGSTAANRAAAQLFEIPESELTLDQVGDVLGEIANRIMGALMPYFDSNGAPVTFGLPLFVGAGEEVLWNKCGAPSLALEFEGAYGAAFVELALTEFLPGPQLLSPLASNEFMEAESCLFL